MIQTRIRRANICADAILPVPASSMPMQPIPLWSIILRQAADMFVICLAEVAKLGAADVIVVGLQADNSFSECALP